jgi:hypothetical protein
MFASGTESAPRAPLSPVRIAQQRRALAMDRLERRDRGKSECSTALGLSASARPNRPQKNFGHSCELFLCSLIVFSFVYGVYGKAKGFVASSKLRKPTDRESGRYETNFAQEIDTAVLSSPAA